MSKDQEAVALDRYMTVSEAAAFLGVSSSTLRNWDRSGKLKSRRHPINSYRLYHKGDLLKLLKDTDKNIAER